jgi:hypothetical protein
MLKGWQLLIDEAKKKSEFEGILVIGSSQIFFDINDIDSLIEYKKAGGGKIWYPILGSNMHMRVAKFGCLVVRSIYFAVKLS